MLFCGFITELPKEEFVRLILLSKFGDQNLVRFFPLLFGFVTLPVLPIRKTILARSNV